uniref:Uncharacterized protein n=1 Tax=Rhizophora mucronata TaxID=61149 RepID=A0A2P2QVS9_RHIMU
MRKRKLKNIVPMCQLKAVACSSHFSLFTSSIQ